ncbi:MAG: Alpha-L-fucosidase [Sphingobacterium sp.]|jgi:alpha-L-fucosidase|nr:Alpha-L-fucosidase [Sphingobacterium sp.]
MTATGDIQAEILGFSNKFVEYRKEFDATVQASQSKLGLVVSAVNGQRFYTDNKWNNAIVLKITGASEIKLQKTKKNEELTIEGAK